MHGDRHVWRLAGAGGIHQVLVDVEQLVGIVAAVAQHLALGIVAQIGHEHLVELQVGAAGLAEGAHTFEVRASITDSVELQRFCVLVPSVRITITLSRSGAGAGALKGATGESNWKPQAMPMVTLVLPVGVIASTLLLSAVQS